MAKFQAYVFIAKEEDLMKKQILCLFLTLTLIMTLMPLCASAEDESYEGKLIILHTNDVHGEITGYAALAAYKKSLEAQGADVLLVDAGDFSQGSPEVYITKGTAAIELMNAVGYDAAAIGNHEFDHTYDELQENIKSARFKLLCANLYNGNERPFDANAVITKGGVKVGFFGLLTPETITSAMPTKIKGLSFLNDDDPYLYGCAQSQIDELRAEGADLVICLSHIGVAAVSVPKSTEIYHNTNGLDFIIDGHSHTVMTEGQDGEPIQSTGTKFENIGMIVIDEETKKIESNKLIPLADLEDKDADVQKIIERVQGEVEKEYGAVVGRTEVELNGERAPGNRTEETNLGDLYTDAAMWFATEKNADTITKVPRENVVSLTNGGGIRENLHIGEITRKDVHTVFPFGNSLQVLYVKGETLLRVLEASTFDTPEAIGSFPQVSGISYTIDCTKEYDAMETPYPGSAYYGPKSIRRVSIQDIGGKPFDPQATYAVIASDFIASGGDAYYEFSEIKDIVDTGCTLDVVLDEYISEKLNGVVGTEYAAPQGRITIITEEESGDDQSDSSEETSPETGDTAEGIVWGMLCVVSLSAALITVSQRKKETIKE